MGVEIESPEMPADETSGRGVVDVDVEGPAPESRSEEVSIRHPEIVGSSFQAFILLRFTLIITTFYLLIAELGATGITAPLILLFIAVLTSNIAALRAPRRWTASGVFTAVVVVFDTLWITLALLLSGRFTAEFFYLYFFVLFLAAIGENLRLIVLGSLVVCVAYVAMVIATTSVSSVLETKFLIRIPFLFAVAIFYGYLVDQLRRERLHARDEAVVIEGLERSRRELEEVNRDLRSEVHERRRVEEALTQAHERLQDLTEVRTRFITTISHEVKTPITSIKNALTVVRKHPEPSVEERFFDIIGRSADRLNLIITDLLDVSRMESGSMRLNAESFDLRESLTRIVDGFTAQAEHAGITLNLRVSDDLPLVWADRRRIEQILTDLMSNALQATRTNGAVVLAARPEDGTVELGVEDTGVGLNDVEKRRVFEPFYQAGDILVDRPPGAGLGLTICRDLARGHGGELHVTSKPGVGSRFFFRVPTDSAQGREIVAFEDDLRAIYRKYPYFGLLVVELPAPSAADGSSTSFTGRSEVLESLCERLRSFLPRDHDRLVPQPAHNRVIVVLLATPRNGCVQVRRQLVDRVGELSIVTNAKSLQGPRILGPACFPEDGLFGGQLIDVALSASAAETGPAGERRGGPTDGRGEEARVDDGPGQDRA